MALTTTEQRAAEMLAGMIDYRNATATARTIHPRDIRKREEATRAAGEVAGYRAALIIALPPTDYARIDREADRIVAAIRADVARLAHANRAALAASN